MSNSLVDIFYLQIVLTSENKITQQDDSQCFQFNA